MKQPATQEGTRFRQPAVRFAPSLDDERARSCLDGIISRTGCGTDFSSSLMRLDDMYRRAVAGCPSPLPEKSLAVTDEMRYAWEQWLPLKSICGHFLRFLSQRIRANFYPDDSCLKRALSWGDAWRQFPSALNDSGNPAVILSRLITDDVLMEHFIFHVLLPRRYYGHPDNGYEAQENLLRGWLKGLSQTALSCLDIGCGIGSGVYRLARLVTEEHEAPGMVAITGITRDPLEVWCAAHACFPPDPEVSRALRRMAEHTLKNRTQPSVLFVQGELEEQADHPETFDLILCNGLLGGPLLHDPARVGNAVCILARMLRPGGLLLAANRFHGGWRNRCGYDVLHRHFRESGLEIMELQEGSGGKRI